MFYRPSGVIEELDEISAKSVGAAAAKTEVEQVAKAEPAPEETVEIEPAQPVAAEAPADVEVGDDASGSDAAVPQAEDAADGTEGPGTAAEDVADRSKPGEGEEPATSGAARSNMDRHSDLLAWLVGDGESLSDLLGSAKQPETYAPAGQGPPRPAPRPLARPPRLDRQSFQRATGAPRPTAPPAVLPPPRPAPPMTVGPPPGPGRRRRTVVLVAAIVAAVALIAGVVALVVPRSGSGTKANATTSQTTTTAPIAPPIRTSPEPVSWVTQNLPTGAAIIAPARIVPLLRAAGFTSVYPDDALRGLGLTNVAYLVGEPTAATPTGRLKKFIDATAPLGYFGTGAAQTMVGQVFRGGTVAMAQAMLDDTKLRAEEGSGLLHNPNVHTDVAMRKVLANGLLDARAGALIGALAGVGQVTVTDPVRSAPEAAAALPYRIITISVSNPVLLDNSVRRADPKYKPVSAVPVGATQRRLTWTPAVAPDKPFR
jgi:hypothetical protein